MEKENYSENETPSCPPSSPVVDERKRKLQEYHKSTYPERREKILAYKKAWYQAKTQVFNSLRQIYLEDYPSRWECNRLKKKYFNADKLLLDIEGKVYTPRQFFECYKCIKDKCLFRQHPWEISDDDMMTIFVQPDVLREKENFMI